MCYVASVLFCAVSSEMGQPGPYSPAGVKLGRAVSRARGARVAPEPPQLPPVSRGGRICRNRHLPLPPVPRPPPPAAPVAVFTEAHLGPHRPLPPLPYTPRHRTLESKAPSWQPRSSQSQKGTATVAPHCHGSAARQRQRQRSCWADKLWAPPLQPWQRPLRPVLALRHGSVQADGPLRSRRRRQPSRLQQCSTQMGQRRPPAQCRPPPRPRLLCRRRQPVCPPTL